MDKNIKQETLDFIFDYTRDASERQLQDAKDLDNKMAQLFSVASVVIGLAGLANSSQGSGWSAWLLVIALGFYVIVAVVALISQFPTVQWRSLHADVLWEEYSRTDVPDIKHALVDDIQRAYGRNNKVLKKKGLMIKIAATTTGAEVLFVGLGLILSRVL